MSSRGNERFDLLFEEEEGAEAVFVTGMWYPIGERERERERERETHTHTHTEAVFVTGMRYPIGEHMLRCSLRPHTLVA
jgi:hypothetical protein